MNQAQSSLSADLKKLITETIRHELKSLNQPSPSSQETMSAIEAATYLKIKVKTLYDKAQNNEIPYSRVGERKYLFFRSDLEEYVLQSKQKSRQQITQEAQDYLRS